MKVLVHHVEPRGVVCIPYKTHCIDYAAPPQSTLLSDTTNLRPSTSRATWSIHDLFWLLFLVHCMPDLDDDVPAYNFTLPTDACDTIDCASITSQTQRNRQWTSHWCHNLLRSNTVHPLGSMLVLSACPYDVRSIHIAFTGHRSPVDVFSPLPSELFGRSVSATFARVFNKYALQVQWHQRHFQTLL